MLGVDHNKIILLSTPFQSSQFWVHFVAVMLFVFYAGNKRCCIALYCMSVVHGTFGCTCEVVFSKREVVSKIQLRLIREMSCLHQIQILDYHTFASYNTIYDS